jgi:putative transposase
LQEGHPKDWKYQRWIRRARARWLRRARNVLMDSAHYLAKRLVKIAEEYEAYIAFENLKKVRENGNHDDDLAWEVQLWCYRRVQEFAKYKALVKGLKTIPVNPRNTSRRSPNGKTLEFIDYKVVELGRGRDLEGCDSILEHCAERAGEVKARTGRRGKGV